MDHGKFRSNLDPLIRTKIQTVKCRESAGLNAKKFPELPVWVRAPVQRFGQTRSRQSTGRGRQIVQYAHVHDARTAGPRRIAEKRAGIWKLDERPIFSDLYPQQSPVLPKQYTGAPGSAVVLQSVTLLVAWNRWRVKALKMNRRGLGLWIFFWKFFMRFSCLEA